MSLCQIILASSSPRRRELLSSIGIDHAVCKPAIDETRYPDEAPLQYARRLSIEKAQVIAKQINHSATILAADTVVILAADTIGIEQNGEILGKPADANEARAMLKRLRGKTHLVCTAYTILVTGKSTRQITRIVCTRVRMRNYSDREIEDYIATGDPFDKAGSYAIQHENFHPVEHIEGSYSNVVGLPIEDIQKTLAELKLI